MKFFGVVCAVVAVGGVQGALDNLGKFAENFGKVDLDFGKFDLFGKGGEKDKPKVKFQTCAAYREATPCPTGFVDSTQEDCVGECTRAECCQETCGIFTGPTGPGCGDNSGFVAASGRDGEGPGSIVCPDTGCTTNLCCVETCGRFTKPEVGPGCPAGFREWQGPAGEGPGSIKCPESGCSTEQCCVATCNQIMDCTADIGNPGFVLIPNAEDVTCGQDGCSALDCCVPTCGFFTGGLDANGGCGANGCEGLGVGPGSVKCPGTARDYAVDGTVPLDGTATGSCTKFSCCNCPVEL